MPSLPDPLFVIVPPIRAVTGPTVWDDIMCRTPKQYKGHGRATEVHESQHHLHAGLRNARYRPGQPRVNVFYARMGRAIVVREPKMSLKSVGPLVPRSMQGYRFNLYLSKQLKWWGDVGWSLYVFDEAFAYLTDSAGSIDDLNRKIPNGDGFSGSGGPEHVQVGLENYPPREYDRPPMEGDGLGASVSYRDGVSSCLEFMIYGIAHYLACQKVDPAFLTSEPQYLRMLAWYCREAARFYFLGSATKEFSKILQTPLLDALRKSKEGAPFRSFLSEHCDGAWLA
jgi:hypothetical protein